MSTWRWSLLVPVGWPDFSFPLMSSSILRLPQLLSSYFSATRGGWWRWWFLRGLRAGLVELNSLSVVLDDVVWSLVTALESVALVSMLGFFFLFCGCTI